MESYGTQTKQVNTEHDHGDLLPRFLSKLNLVNYL